MYRFCCDKNNPCAPQPHAFLAENMTWRQSPGKSRNAYCTPASFFLPSVKYTRHTQQRRPSLRNPLLNKAALVKNRISPLDDDATLGCRAFTKADSGHRITSKGIRHPVQQSGGADRILRGHICRTKLRNRKTLHKYIRSPLIVSSC